MNWPMNPRNMEEQQQSQQFDSEIQESKTFRLSVNSLENNNIKQFQRSNLDYENSNNILNQQKLKLIQNIALLKISNSLQHICFIFGNKALSKLTSSFGKIKNCGNLTQNFHKITFSSINQQAAAVSPLDRDLFIQIGSLFYRKIANIVQSKQLKNVSFALSQIYLYQSIGVGMVQRTRSIQKSESIVNQYRASSKIDNLSEKNDSEWDIGISQGYEHSEGTIRQNKMLRKKKSKMQSNREHYLSKMDELLSAHQTFLDKLN